MSIFVGGQTALDLVSQPRWRWLVQTPRKKLAVAFKTSCPDTHELEDACANELAGVSRPLCVLVPVASSRRYGRGMRPRVWGEALPDGAFLAVSRKRGIFVATPEFAFVQLAWGADELFLIRTALCICGTYHPTSRDMRGFWTREPLATPASLARTASALAGTRGAGKAQRALRFALPGSASPMETALVMLLCLPCRLGGYGLPAPKLNYAIDCSRRYAGRLDASYMVCDLYWPEARLDVEYDSDAFHTGAERIAHDSRRRDALSLLGVTVVTVTARQAYDVRELDRVARLVACKLGHRIRTDTVPDWPKRRDRLRESVLACGPRHTEDPSDAGLVGLTPTELFDDRCWR